MLEGSFYTIISEGSAENLSGKYFINIKPEHPIFKGHFPEKGIVPGVCMIQIIQELVSKMISKKVMLKNAANIKFLNIIDPEVHIHIEVKIDCTFDHENVKTIASLTEGTTTFMKLQAVFS